MQSGQIILYFVRFFKYLVFEVQKLFLCFIVYQFFVGEKLVYFNLKQAIIKLCNNE